MLNGVDGVWLMGMEYRKKERAVYEVKWGEIVFPPIYTLPRRLGGKEVGAKMGQQGPPGARKDFFSKMILDHMECQNKCGAF